MSRSAISPCLLNTSKDNDSTTPMGQSVSVFNHSFKEIFPHIQPEQLPLSRALHNHCPTQTLPFFSPCWPLQQLWGAVEHPGCLSHSSYKHSHEITKLDCAGGWSGRNLWLHAASMEPVQLFKRHLCRKLPPLLPSAQMELQIEHQVFPPLGSGTSLGGIFISTPSLHCSPWV